jgi:hypothetical protein
MSAFDVFEPPGEQGQISQILRPQTARFCSLLRFNQAILHFLWAL